MKYEDTTKELYLLQKGLSKLMQYGLATFEMFADEVGLSYCDRNRVIGKARIAGKGDYVEQPCPRELKNERWLFYTQTCGYSNEKAKKAIAIIDASYKNKPIDRVYDINKLAGGIGGV